MMQSHFFSMCGVVDGRIRGSEAEIIVSFSVASLIARIYTSVGRGAKNNFGETQVSSPITWLHRFHPSAGSWETAHVARRQQIRRVQGLLEGPRTRCMSKAQLLLHLLSF